MPRGDWMQTYTGRAFYPLDPDLSDIDERDIAHALGHICRYGGHAQRFYSVAEHCVLMSKAVAPEHALWALLHDATEAYLGDIIRPLKRDLPAYAEAEDRLMSLIAKRFGLPDQCPDEVSLADRRILLDERESLMRPPPLSWKAVEGMEPLGVTIWAWSPRSAALRYLDRLSELAVI